MLNTCTFTFRTLSLLFLLFNVYITVCVTIQTMRFNRNTDFNDKICVDSERIFQVSARSKVLCSKMCDGRSGCISVFYEAATMTCTTCRGYTNVEEQSGTIFLAKMIDDVVVSCDTLPSVDHVEINFPGSSNVGDKATYTCTLCYYSPVDGVGEITCQADGTWSTPFCGPAADVGFHPNGQPIPSGSVGCISTHGQSCLGLSFAAHVGSGLRIDGTIGACWCGSLCCGVLTICCFDVKC